MNNNSRYDHNGRVITLTEDQVREIKTRYSKGESPYRIGKEMGLNWGRVKKVITNGYKGEKNRRFIDEIKM